MTGRLDDAEMQVSEIEMLQSMFPDDGEVVLDDELTFIETKKFLEDSGEDPNKTLKIALKLGLQETNCVLDVSITLPLNYPSAEMPLILVRSQNMNKAQYKSINEEMKKYIEELGAGDLQIFQIIEWLNENGPNYVTIQAESNTSAMKAIKKPEGPQEFSRIWIYSHHIYSKEKRKNILEWSKELELTGFSMPGKPGVVCVEGPQDNCEEFWQRIKRLNWKHIEVRHREENIERESIKEERKFSEMSEISFEVHGNRGNHMNMGSLFQYLNEHDCGKVFVYLFGVEGRLPEKMKRQTWKRLNLVHKEDGILDLSGGHSTFIRKFHESVMEKDFGVHGGRDYHMDLGQFATYLSEHQSHNVFSILFGVEGRVKSDDKAG